MNLPTSLLVTSIAVSIGWWLGRKFARWRLRRNAPHYPAILHPELECTCPARLGACACADINGVRNPRGAGRGRMWGAR